MHKLAHLEPLFWFSSHKVEPGSAVIVPGLVADGRVIAERVATGMAMHRPVIDGRATTGRAKRRRALHGMALHGLTVHGPALHWEAVAGPALCGAAVG